MFFLRGYKIKILKIEDKRSDTYEASIGRIMVEYGRINDEPEIKTFEYRINDGKHQTLLMYDVEAPQVSVDHILRMAIKAEVENVIPDSRIDFIDEGDV